MLLLGDWLLWAIRASVEMTLVQGGLLGLLGLSHLITVRGQPPTYLIPVLWLPVASTTPGASKEPIGLLLGE